MCKMLLFIFLLYLADHVRGKFLIIKTKQEKKNISDVNSKVKGIGEDFSLGKDWAEHLQVVFEKYTFFSVEKSKKLHKMKSMGKEFRISCRIMLKSTSFSEQYYSILHFTTGENGGKTGRIPAVWMQRNGLLLVSTIISGKGNTFKEIYYGGTTKFNLLIQQYHVRAAEYVFEVFINGKKFWSVANHSPEEYSNVYIYAGDPWYEPLNGYIRKLKVETSGGFCDPLSTTTTSSTSTTTSKSDCKCGLANRKSRIVGGEETGVNEYPWQVGITMAFHTRPPCGGTLISNQWVLTAAHCITSKDVEYYKAVLGEHNFELKDEAESITISIVKIVKHPQYSKSTDDYDFSLLKMAETVDFSKYPNIRPICLPNDRCNKYNNIEATVTGWGTLKSDGKVPDVLMGVDVTVISNSACREKYPEYKISSQMLCAHVDGGGKDSCQGDSGGPLITAGSGSGVTAGENYELIGVVSWGVGCAQPDNPGVYARVTEQLDWIKSTTATGWSTCPRQ